VREDRPENTSRFRFEGAGAPRPCRICGFHAPDELCPHCAGSPLESSLCRPPRSPLAGVPSALLALPRGILYYLATPGARRLLIPPLAISLAALVATSTWVFSLARAWLGERLPGGVRLTDLRGSLQGLPGPLESALLVLVKGLEWTLTAALSLATSTPVRWLGWFLLGSLVLWFAFSFVYEVIAGPFLDEIQARLETRWFGSDPRKRLERPTDLAPERCFRLTLGAATTGAAAFLLLWFSAWVPGLVALLGVPLGFVPWMVVEPRYGVWLRWVARIEGRATLASLQAGLVTATLIACALPLYFVPVWGYPVFAGVCGFATAVGLLDIPFSRRGWTRRQRWRFLAHNALPLTVFGTLSGLLLAIPLLGPLLLVPAASLGGLWLLCRLDKGPLR